MERDDSPTSHELTVITDDPMGKNLAALVISIFSAFLQFLNLVYAINAYKQRPGKFNAYMIYIVIGALVYHIFRCLNVRNTIFNIGTDIAFIRTSEIGSFILFACGYLMVVLWR